MSSREQIGALGGLLGLSGDEQEARGLRHTPREIRQQPATWEQTYRLCAERAPELREWLAAAGIGAAGAARPAVWLIGAGTSDYVGRSLTHLLRRAWQCEVLAVPSTDLLTEYEELILPGRPYLWLSFSRSGESPEGVAALALALERYPAIRHFVITCNRRGRMAEQFGSRPGVSCLVLAEAVNDRGLVMTSSYSNMVIAGQCLAHLPGLADYEGTLAALAGAAERLLAPAADLATQLSAEGYDKACFVGTGPLKAAARESALKVLELTAGRVDTLAESSLGIRHGPLSALDDRTLLVSFLSGDERRRGYELDLLAEVKAKRLGKTTVAIAPARGDRAEGVADVVLPLDLPRSFSDACRPPADVIFGQLLGLFASLRLGLRPDAPSPSGAITRVVPQVNIY